jgi:protein O-GlcNAc transferase
MARSRPTDPALEAALARGVAFHQAGRTAEAESAYRSILARAPEHPQALNYLGMLLSASGQLEAGLDLLRRSVKHAPTVPELQLNLADVLIGAGRLDAAGAAIRKSLSLRRSADGLSKLGLLLFRQNKPKPASQQLQQALALDPGHLAGRHNLAVITAELGELDAALTLLRGLIALAPTHVEGLNAMAALEQRIGQMEPAATRLRRAIALTPDHAPAHANYGVVLGILGHPAAAARHARKALALLPADPGLWTNLSNEIQTLAGPADSERLLRRVVAIRPRSNADDWSNLARVLGAQSKHDAALATYRRALELDPNHSIAHSNLIFLLDLHPHATFAEQQEERRRWFARHGAKFAAHRNPHRNNRDPDRRLRLGYVSADFRRHSAQSLFGPIIRRHDQSNFAIACYSGGLVEDEITQSLKAASTLWRSILGRSVDAIADQIEADAIDILIDLSGYSAGHQLEVFARKPAPIQISAWGYVSNGTGLPTVDYLFSDPVLIPMALRSHFAETIYDLPCFSALEAPVESPPLGSSSPPGDALVFGSFNRVTKLTDDLLSTWSRILHALPSARLLTKDVGFDDPDIRSRFLSTFARCGVDAARIKMRGRTSRIEHLAAMSEAHISLDPFPQSGGVTTFESVFMGVPVVTLAGESPTTRSSAAILAALGLGCWIASDPESYISLAIQRAGAIAREGVPRSDLRRKFLASPATDIGRYTLAVEAAYRDMWQHWCRLPPKSATKAKR